MASPDYHMVLAAFEAVTFVGYIKWTAEFESS